MADSYTIRIAPTSGSAGASATLVVELASGEPRVTEVVIRAGTGEDTLPEEMLNVDFPELLRAVSAMSRGARPASDSSTAPSAADQDRDHGEAMPLPGFAEHPPRPRRASPKNSNAIPEPPSDLGKMYWKLATVAKVAGHYRVSRHVAQDWIRGLRKSGALPNPWRAPDSPAT